MEIKLEIERKMGTHHVTPIKVKGLCTKFPRWSNEVDGVGK
jgi:hypothetical protein